jgi:DNA-binding NarL/FixJ family response regulator
VLIVDDHAVIRQGLAVLIDEEEDLTVVGEAESGEEAIEAARRLTPEVVVMDFTMGGMDGAEATRRIKAELPDTRVIGLSMHLEDDTPQWMLDAGAEVYLPKEGPSEDVIAAIRQT